MPVSFTCVFLWIGATSGGGLFGGGGTTGGAFGSGLLILFMREQSERSDAFI